MLKKRIIPCLDVADGRVKKGINFNNLTNVGDPVTIAKRYNDQGADELVFLDITATNEHRNTTVEMVKNVAKAIFMPFTVGGGIRSIDDMQRLLYAGADKVSLNSIAVHNPEIITKGAEKFGSQCIVVALDVKWQPAQQRYEIYINGGKTATGIDALKWAKQVVALGAGELLVTSMDKDGTKSGYDIKLYQALDKIVNVPVIASGGCGNLADFAEVFAQTNVDAALAASVFHYQELTIPQVKADLQAKKVPVRL